jgi:GT2 family glycosyltransferase
MPRQHWLLNATENHAGLADVCAQSRAAGVSLRVLYRRRDRDAILAALPAGELASELADEGFEIPGLVIEDDAEMVFLPCAQRIEWAGLRERPLLGFRHCIQPLFATPPRLNPNHHSTGPAGWWGWRADGALARRILREPATWNDNGIDIIEVIAEWPDPPRWHSAPLSLPGADDYPVTSRPVLTLDSRVLAVISHFRCEQWLHECLTSMTQQTVPLANIVVMDDCSGAPPLSIIEQFPSVTLLSNTRNAGPERMLNNLIHATDYDGYMVQDADDWSTHDRLEVSLRGAEQSGADMVGTQEIRVDHSVERLDLGLYPPDVTRCMKQGPMHYNLHGTCLIGRSLAMRVGGFDENLSLTGDSDFTYRAWHVGRIINLPAYTLFHRIRPHSLTSHTETGYRSRARLVEDYYIKVRAIKQQKIAMAGGVPDVRVQLRKPLHFEHLCGPALTMQKSGTEGVTIAWKP